MGGPANEAGITIEGIDCCALLDTGSTITTVSESFYKEQLSEIPLHTLEEILEIECADGNFLPYTGYIEASVSIPSIADEAEHTTILLVIPDTEYNRRVPVLLGTNVLRPLMDMCQQQNGPRYLQTVARSTPWWLTFRSIHVEDKALDRTEGRLGLVKSAHRDTVIIPKNGSAMVSAFVTDKLTCNRLAMMHPTAKTVL